MQHIERFRAGDAVLADDGPLLVRLFRRCRALLGLGRNRDLHAAFRHSFVAQVLSHLVRAEQAGLIHVRFAHRSVQRLGLCRMVGRLLSVVLNHLWFEADRLDTGIGLGGLADP